MCEKIIAGVILFLIWLLFITPSIGSEDDTNRGYIECIKIGLIEQLTLGILLGTVTGIFFLLVFLFG